MIFDTLKYLVRGEVARMKKAKHAFAGSLVLSAQLMAAPIQASEPQVSEGFIAAPVAEVWRLFTTSEGYKVLGPHQAEVDLRIGGTIRAHYDPKGQLGDPETVVNEILAYDPEHMLAIRNLKPPASFRYPRERQGTWTVIYFTSLGESTTQVRIVDLGHRDDERSQAMRRLFAEGNRWTLDNIIKNYAPRCASPSPGANSAPSSDLKCLSTP
jgi:uncharacterized protein YndB with AHSA1/START domain